MRATTEAENLRLEKKRQEALTYISDHPFALAMHWRLRAFMNRRRKAAENVIQFPVK